MFKGENEMKKTLKTLMTLGLASVMLFTTAITSFAAAVPENVVTIFGQTPVQRSTHEHATTGEIFVRNYEAIIYGRTTLNADDINLRFFVFYIKLKLILRYTLGFCDVCSGRLPPTIYNVFKFSIK